MANNNKHTGPNVPALRFPEFSGEWETFQLSDLAAYSKERVKMEILSSDNYVSTENMQQDFAGIKDAISLPSSGTAVEFQVGDILISNIRPYLNKIWLSDRNGGCSTDVLALRTKNEKVDSSFLYCCLANDDFVSYVMSGAKGVKMPRGDKQHILSYNLGVPSVQEQRRIAELVSLLEKRISAQSKIIEEQETLLRSLRHKIYSKVQAESQCTIADVLCYEQPTKYLVTDTDYTDDDSQVPVLTANKAFILGYTTENFGIYDKGPCIILDDFTLDCKYVDFKFKVKSSAIKILRAKAKTNVRFIFEYFRFLELNTTEHRRHYIAEIEPMSILLPSNEEIDRIACLFTALDERLEAARKELKILESQKMYMLQKMFI